MTVSARDSSRNSTYATCTAAAAAIRACSIVTAAVESDTRIHLHGMSVVYTIKTIAAYYLNWSRSA
jgi:hypothetical protein